MERRDFVRGVGGLVVVAALGGIAGPRIVQSLTGSPDQGNQASQIGQPVFITSSGIAPEAAVGPVMAADIELRATADGAQGHYDGVHLFNVDALGAQLVKLADGSRTIEQIVASTQASNPAFATLPASSAAAFFVQLGQAGYLQNQVYVTLYENCA
jgi:hypothetical protein